MDSVRSGREFSGDGLHNYTVAQLHSFTAYPPPHQKRILIANLRTDDSEDECKDES